MHALHVVGARPNFVKMAPLIRALDDHTGIRSTTVHTGQHYDERLSAEVLGDLQLPEPDRFLGVGSGRHGAQTAKVLAAMEDVLLEFTPDVVVVAGDVNSTLGAALAASKLGIRIAHVESGLRSRDWSMPEEINRVLTDRLSDLLFTHSPEAADNLAEEGIRGDRVAYVGNSMIDSLRRYEKEARERRAWETFGVQAERYVLVTLHRPSNVDTPERLAQIVEALGRLAQRCPVVFPVHPRTRARLEASGEPPYVPDLHWVDPMGYLDFLSLQLAATAVVTDSGGVQEETSALGVPCYTLRPNTERPITLTAGTNTLLGDDPASISAIALTRRAGPPPVIPLWDGRAGERMAARLVEPPR